MTPVVVMGVSGAGKSTVAPALAAALDVPVAEGDCFHPAANVSRMAAGVPLDDEDRWPWLRSLREWVDAHPASVVTCSALRRDYRDVLRPAFFVALDVPVDVLTQRVGARTGHVMPASLLPSQLDLLEPLGPDEDGITVDATRPVTEVVAEVLRALPFRRRPPGPRGG